MGADSRCRVGSLRRALVTVSVAAVAVASVAGCGSTNGNTQPVDDPEVPPATVAGGAASFPLPKDPGATIKAAGLPELAPDVPKPVHYHAHLSIEVEGHQVVVPAGLGTTKSGMSPLHTEADLGATDPGSTGIVHVEAELSEPPKTYTVGQLFTEWGIKLDKNCLATYCNDEHKQLLGIRNGEIVPDPASIPLSSHDEVVIWYGPRNGYPEVPATYEFPPALNP